MKKVEVQLFLETIADLCKVCYTCVRECPVKAIRIENGQSKIIPDRCINCGNCVKVCSQGAKQFVNPTTTVDTYLNSNDNCIAMIAPSFAAEFREIKDHRNFVGMLKCLGFDIVTEVAFGADLVANKYREIFKSEKSMKTIITANCPAIVSYVEKYHPDLVDKISSIVSPMIAMARVLRKKYGDCKIVFIGPCIAKRREAFEDSVAGEVDEVITFNDLRVLFEEKRCALKRVVPIDFDPPHGGKGALLPIARGLLQSVDIVDDITKSNVLSTEGRSDFPQIIRELESNDLENHHLDLLCCNGCTMGPGMSENGNRFVKKIAVSNYVRNKLESFDFQQWQEELGAYSDLDLERIYSVNDQRITAPSVNEIENILRRMGKERLEDELDCEACGYRSCREHAIAIYKGLAESDMCLPYTISELDKSLEELKLTKAALHQSEKLASMGQLAAGIAHEVNNPLGTVLLYSHLLMDEMDAHSESYSDLKMIADHALRCKNIVSGLLNFSRKNEVNYQKVDVVEFLQSTLNEIVTPKAISIKLKNRLDVQFAEFDPDQMRQVLSNIIRNAIEAIEDVGKIRVETGVKHGQLYFKIKDNGHGIEKEHLEKLFVPFFTTKPVGRGTGLGLPVSYGIVKMHRGTVSVTSDCDRASKTRGTIFKIEIPLKGEER